MDDLRINLAIAKFEYPDATLYESNTKDSVRIYNNYPKYIIRNYCSNWSDIGPIIEREKIDVTVNESGNGWEANTFFFESKTTAETPTKAAALCYLRFKEIYYI